MIIILTIIFIAALLQGAVGFGFALVAMPALALLMDAPSAAALVALCAAVISAIMLAQHRRAVAWSEAAGLIFAAAAGVPVGVFALAHAPRDVLIVALGVVISAFSLWSLAQTRPIELKDRRWRFVAGFLGGVLGGTYNVSGPPVVLYGAMRRWPPPRFLGVMQAFFLPTALFIAAGHAVAGFWTENVLTLFAASVPVIFVAGLIGKRVAALFSAEMLTKTVYGLCFVLGAMIVVTNIF